MVDVDALTRQFGSLIATHCAIAQSFRKRDLDFKPTAYAAHTFKTYSTSQLAAAALPCGSLPILSSSIIHIVPDILSLDSVLEPEKY